MSPGRLSKLKPKAKIWLELKDEPVFGDGKVQWLELIEKTGSLRAAAEAIGMSYRGLWGRLREMERRLGLQLVTRRAGGSGGGGTELTDAGRDLIRRYRRFRQGLDEVVAAQFKATFGRK